MLAPQWRSTNQFGIADRFNFAGIAGECSVHCQLNEIVGKRSTEALQIVCAESWEHR
ncbi:hypothetical protein ABIF74_008946 [Bradyrhizobium japonicum]